MLKYILCFIFMFFMLDSVLAINIEVDKTFTMGAEMVPCQPYDGYYACHFNNNDMGYRFTVVNNKNTRVVATESVDLFDNSKGWSKGKLYYYTNGEQKNLSNLSMYITGYKNGTSNVYSTDIERISLGGQQSSSDSGISGLSSMLNEIKKGDNLFNSILQKAGVKIDTFISNNYAILIEPIYVIGYTEKNSLDFKFVLGTSSNIAEFLYNNYQFGSYKLIGLTKNFVPNLAYNVCTGTVCTNKQIVSSDSVTTVKNNLQAIYTQYGYGVTKVTAEDISTGVPSCSTRLKKLGTNPTKQQLINLYKDYPNNKSLLNFNNPSCSPAACEYSKNSGCLSGSYSLSNSTFNENNLSCFTDTFDVGGNTAYCLTTFNFDNKVGTNWITRAGGMIFYTSDGIVMNSKLRQVCYLFNSTAQSFQTGSYSDYLSDVSLKINNVTKILNTDKLVSSNLILKKEPGTIKYSGEVSINYLIDRVYLKNGTGEMSETDCDNCNFLSYGIISRLNDSGSYEMPFSFKFRSDTYSGTCSYNVVPELITTNNYLELEFRTIDVDEPFIGKTGNGREPGSNWCVDRITNRVMDERNDSYNKESSEPLYTITLTPQKIINIRNYNKDHAYDEYELDCTSGTCENVFLKDTSIFTRSDMRRITPQWEIDYNNNSILMGDVNNDGVVHLIDAIALSQYLDLKDSCIDKEAADVTGDGKIDKSDVNKMFDYFNGKISSLQ